MSIAGVDITVTKMLSSRLNRRSNRAASQVKHTSTTQAACQIDFSDVAESTTTNDSDTGSDASVALLVERKGEKGPAQTRIKLPTVALVCDRTGTSKYVAGLFVSAALHDAKEGGIIKDEEEVASSSIIADASKIQREVNKTRDKLTEKLDDELTGHCLKALFFDGRDDVTCAYEKKFGKRVKITTKEGHVVLIEEPGTKYIGHIAPKSKSAQGLHDSCIEYLREKQVILDELVAVGSDGTNVNTGHLGGMIRKLEETIGHALQWLICLLHLNELPFRHLFISLDGTTNSPNSYSGPIGKQLDTCHDLPVVKYRSMPFTAPEVDVDALSNDQRYLLKMSIAIGTGECPPNLAAMKPGRVVTSRWLTTAARVLRLYVSTSKPTDNMKLLVKYILNVYVPVWFAVKTQPTCKDGAKHVWLLISKSRFLPKYAQKIVNKVIQTNAYFAHPENVLLAMLFDKRRQIKKFAVAKIKLAREQAKDIQGIRHFVVPPIRFHAAEYTDLIPWQSKKNCLLTKPPLTKHLSDDALDALAQTGEEASVLSSLPCHSQAVERAVKTVTEAAARVHDADKRHGLILAKNESRRYIPAFKSKKDFKPGQK